MRPSVCGRRRAPRRAASPEPAVRPARHFPGQQRRNPVARESLAHRRPGPARASGSGCPRRRSMRQNYRAALLDAPSMALDRADETLWSDMALKARSIAPALDLKSRTRSVRAASSGRPSVAASSNSPPIAAIAALRIIWWASDALGEGELQPPTGSRRMRCICSSIKASSRSSLWLVRTPTRPRNASGTGPVTARAHAVHQTRVLPQVAKRRLCCGPNAGGRIRRRRAATRGRRDRCAARDQLFAATMSCSNGSASLKALRRAESTEASAWAASRSPMMKTMLETRVARGSARRDRRPRSS